MTRIPILGNIYLYCYTRTIPKWQVGDNSPAPLSHSKRREKPSYKNQTIGKLRDPSHFLGPIFVNSKHPFPATKRAFEVNKGLGRTDVSTSRYERIVKFDKVFVYLCPLVERHDHFFKELRATHPNSLENTNRFFTHRLEWPHSCSHSRSN